MTIRITFAFQIRSKSLIDLDILSIIINILIYTAMKMYA